MNAAVVSFQSTHFDFYHRHSHTDKNQKWKQRNMGHNGGKIKLNLAQCDST